MIRMEIKALVVEDEVAAANRLVKMIKEVDPDISVVQIADSIESALSWLRVNPEPDLMFLDIHLADGSGFEIFEGTRINCPVIFTTAYDKYAVQAFKVNSIDYLLKPVKHEELLFSINKFKNSNYPSLNIEALKEEIRKQKAPEWQKRFIIRYADKLKSVDSNEIAYFIAREKSVFLVTNSGPGYAIDYTLDKLESVLDPDIFFRINRKFIVSFGCISSMYHYSKSRVKLELKPEPDSGAIVSSERAAGFKGWLNR